MGRKAVQPREISEDEVYGPPYSVVDTIEEGKDCEVFRSDCIYTCLGLLKRLGTKAKLIRLQDGTVLAFNKVASTPIPRD